MATIEEVLAGPALRKLLFMTSPQAVESHLKPHWQAALAGTAAETMQAVPDMLGGCWALVGAGCLWVLGACVGHRLVGAGGRCLLVGAGNADMLVGAGR